MKHHSLGRLTTFALALVACASTPSTQEITLEGVDTQFSLTTLAVTAGTPVKLTFKNIGVLEHDFSVLEISVEDVTDSGNAEDGGHDMGAMTDTPDLHISAKPGESGVLEFTPTKPGTYDFVCTTPGHKELGMVGTLVVK